MKKLLSLFGFTIIFATALSQNINYKLNQGEVIQLKNSNFVMNTRELGVIDKYAYFLMSPFQRTGNDGVVLMTPNYFIYKFDFNNNLIKTTALELVRDKKELNFEGAMRLKKDIFVFSSFQNNKDKKHYLFVQNFNIKTDALENNAKLIAELDYSGYSKFKNTTFTMEVSPDSSKVLIFYSLINKDNEVLRSGINVFDNQMYLLWKNDDVTAQFSSGNFSFLNFNVTNTGEVFLLGRHLVNSENYWNKSRFLTLSIFRNLTFFVDVPDYTYRVYHYSSKTTKVEGYTFGLPNKFIRDMNIYPLDNGNILCSGIFSDPGKVSATGTFCFEYDASSTSISNISTSEFGKELITKELKDDELKTLRRSMDNKQEWDPFGYIISSIKTKQNGERYFVAEQYLSGLYAERSGRYTVTHLIHFYKDLYVVSLNKQNQISKIDKISKKQYYLDEYKYSSYKSIEKNNTLYFFFNTFEKSDKLAYNVDVLESFIVRLDENGNQTRAIFKTKAEFKDPLPILQNSMQVTDNSILFMKYPIKLFTIMPKISLNQLIINE